MNSTDMIINGQLVRNVKIDAPYIIAKEVNGQLQYCNGFINEATAIDIAFETDAILIRNLKRCGKCAWFSDLDMGVYICEDNCCGGCLDNQPCEWFEEAQIK